MASGRVGDCRHLLDTFRISLGEGGGQRGPLANSLGYIQVAAELTGRPSPTEFC